MNVFMSVKPRPCHHCRRRRLRCDASVPFCMKCTTAGRQCPGYAQLLRWSDGFTNRGDRKLRQPPEGIKAATKQSRKHNNPVESVWPSAQISEKQDEPSFSSGSPGNSKMGLQLFFHLLDPSVKDFSHTDRYYLSHCKVFTPRQHVSDSL